MIFSSNSNLILSVPELIQLVKNIQSLNAKIMLNGCAKNLRLLGLNDGIASA